jgi:hypothetical protein
MGLQPSIAIYKVYSYNSVNHLYGTTSRLTVSRKERVPFPGYVFKCIFCNPDHYDCFVRALVHTVVLTEGL